MNNTYTCQALVLRTYDVGEADRYCILLTRERGRIAARASGARRLGSRLGGYLLPFSHLQLGLKEGSSGIYVSSAASLAPRLSPLTDHATLACAQEGMEVLLSLVSHEEPDPALFDATLQFLTACHPEPDEGRAHQATDALPYIIRVLEILGMLPAQESLAQIMHLSPAERSYIHEARKGNATPELERRSLSRLRDLCHRLMEDHLSTSLKVPGVAATL